jgi:hypothetical protein
MVAAQKRLRVEGGKVGGSESAFGGADAHDASARFAVSL